MMTTMNGVNGPWLQVDGWYMGKLKVLEMEIVELVGLEMEVLDVGGSRGSTQVRKPWRTWWVPILKNMMRRLR